LTARRFILLKSFLWPNWEIGKLVKTPGSFIFQKTPLNSHQISRFRELTAIFTSSNKTAKRNRRKNTKSKKPPEGKKPHD
jgi:hypothetical protein